MPNQVVIIIESPGHDTSIYSKVKSLIELIGDESILERQIRFFQQLGYSEFLILFTDNNENYKNHIQHLKRTLSIDINYLFDTSKCGTAKLLLNAFSRLQSEFLLVYGGILFNAEINGLDASLTESNVDLTVLYMPSIAPLESELLEIDSAQRVKRVLKVTRNVGFYRNHGSIKCFAIKRYILEAFISNNKINSEMDFQNDLFPRILEEGFVAKGLRYVGSILDCTKTIGKGIEKKLELMGSVQSKRPAIFLDRDGTLNKLNGYVTRLDQIIVFKDVPFFVAEMKKLNYYLIVVTNQPVIATGEVSFETLNKIHAKIEQSANEIGGIIDDFFFCPHHSNTVKKVEFKDQATSCKCRKPEIGLILQACDRYPIDLSCSWVIGDTWRDADLAKNAGVKFIKINTENQTSNDFFKATSLSDAAKIIIEHSNGSR